MVEVAPTFDAVLREVSLAWEDRFRALFDSSFRKYIRILHGPPSRDRIGGKLPMVAIHLFDIHLTEHAQTSTRHRRQIRRIGDLRGLRMDYQFSAWAEEPLDEQLLLDRIRSDVDVKRTLDVSPADGEAFQLSISPKPSLKFENTIAFWSSMGWPPKVSLQYSVKGSA